MECTGACDIRPIFRTRCAYFCAEWIIHSVFMVSGGRNLEMNDWKVPPFIYKGDGVGLSFTQTRISITWTWSWKDDIESIHGLSRKSIHPFALSPLFEFLPKQCLTSSMLLRYATCPQHTIYKPDMDTNKLITRDGVKISRMCGRCAMSRECAEMGV